MSTRARCNTINHHHHHHHPPPSYLPSSSIIIHHHHSSEASRHSHAFQPQDELAKERQQLPWHPVKEDYVFTCEDGTVKLSDLFVDGKKDLAVYHLMWNPERERPCSVSEISSSSSSSSMFLLLVLTLSNSLHHFTQRFFSLCAPHVQSCCLWVDSVVGLYPHLAQKMSFAAVCRAPAVSQIVFIAVCNSFVLFCCLCRNGCRCYCLFVRILIPHSPSIRRTSSRH